MENLQKARQPERLPVVFTPEEAHRVLANLTGQTGLMARLLYGSGLRVQEAVTLRVKDIDFGYQSITLRRAKGNKDRVTLLAEECLEPLKQQIEWRQSLQQLDLSEGAGYVDLPNALNRKYPNAETSFGWQYLFPYAFSFGEKNGEL